MEGVLSAEAVGGPAVAEPRLLRVEEGDVLWLKEPVPEAVPASEEELLALTEGLRERDMLLLEEAEGEPAEERDTEAEPEALTLLLGEALPVPPSALPEPEACPDTVALEEAELSSVGRRVATALRDWLRDPVEDREALLLLEGLLEEDTLLL